MAVVIKSNEGKSILILKHSEYPYFSYLSKKIINSIRKNFFVIVYFGYHTVLEEDLRFIDGYVASKGVLEIESSKVPRIYLNGYNFIPDSFKSAEIQQRMIDFCFIGDVTPRKGLSEILNTMQCLYNTGWDAKILLIIRINSKNKFYRHYEKKFYQTIDNIFDTHALSNINFIILDAGRNLKLSSDLVSKLMNDSKCLLLPSRGEGAARVFSEAKLSGMDTICYAEMRGGTLAKTFSNDLLYRSQDELYTLLKNYEYKGPQPSELTEIEKTFLTKFSTPKLLEFLQNLNVTKKDTSIHLNPEQMYNLLSSHQRMLPRYIPSAISSDECLSIQSMHRLADHILDSNITVNFIYAAFLNRIISLQRYTHIIKQKIQSIIG